MFRPLFFLLLAGLAGASFVPAKSAPSPAARAMPTAPLPPADMSHLPWTDGETLTYVVSWMAFDAAQGAFSAHDKGDHWEFNLDLASSGMVSRIYPFTCYFWSLLAKSPW